MSKKICITGVNGFIGTVSADAFLKAGYTVIGIDWAPQPTPLVPAGVQYFCLDICDSTAMAEIFNSVAVNVVYHHAGIKYVSVCEAEPERCYKINHGGTLSILDAMKKANIRHIVFSSTYKVVDDTQGTNIEVTEDFPTQPTSVYGKSKVASEESIIKAKEAGDIDTYHILRYGNIFGRVLPKSFKVESIIDRIVDAALNNTPITLLGNEHQTKDGTIARDFVDVRDVIKAHLLVAENETSGIYNIAAGRAITLREIITAVETVTGKTVQVEIKEPQAEPDSVTVVSTRAFNAFGWKADTPLLDTVTQLVAIASTTTD